MRKPDPATRAMFQRNGWPSLAQARILTVKQLALRYTLVLVVGALIGGPAAIVVTVKHFC